MRCPDYLTGEAAKLWKKHAKRLEAAELLTDADAEAFATLCEVWGLLRTANPTAADPKERVWYIGLLKQWQSLAKQFALLPKDRLRSGLDTTRKETDEYGL
jgi:hypothetical protein